MSGINKSMTNTQLLSQDEFIQRCKALYKDLYSYEKTIYKNSRSTVILTCPTHGDFTKNARSVLSGTGCPECQTNWKDYVQRRRLTNEQFIQKAIDLHEGFYSYSQTKYVNSRSAVIVTCPIHGDFTQLAGGHLEGYGCQQCADKKHGDYRPWYIETYFKRFPEKINVPATLYLLYNKKENFYKVGITTKENVADRIKYIAHYTFEIVDTVTDTMYNVSIAEQKILKEHDRYKPTKRFGGYSECLKNYVDIKLYLPEKGRKPCMEEKRT
jgi:hypothetical protein